LVFSFAREIQKFGQFELIGNIDVRFLNESGVDQGGLRAELLCKVAKELFSPGNGLFKLTPNENNLEINPMSFIVPNHLKLLQFAGLVLAKVYRPIYLKNRQSWKRSQLM
jgi:hypothetical protein